MPPTTIEYDPDKQQLTLGPNPDPEDARLARWQKRTAFTVALIALALMFAIAAWFLFIVAVPAPTSADAADVLKSKDWARSVILALVTGVVGYAFGKK